jgi:1-phosphatidylinositol-3-phosphate 5-kinase
LNTGYRLFTSSKTQPDPDQEDIVWDEPEHYSAVISRKEHGRDASSLLSIRDVLGRKVTPTQPTPVEHSLNGAAEDANITPNTEVVGGVINAADVTEEVEQEVTPTASGQETPKPELASTSNAVMESVIEESSDQSESGDKRTESARLDTPELDTKLLPPPLPAKDGMVTVHEIAQNTSSGFTVGLTTSLNTAMKYISGAESPSRFLVRGVSNARHPGSRSVDMHSIDDRPHIKYDWTMGKRVKFSCTVYYAKQFELLRKKCGVHETFVTSLSKSANWAAEGGKSKSNFWKTSDQRFIIKSLVNAWNVADLLVYVFSSLAAVTHHRC